MKKTIVAAIILVILALAGYALYQKSGSGTHFHDDGVPHSH